MKAMKKLVCSLLLFPLLCSAQDMNSIWIFGDSAGIDFRNPSNPVPIIDFRNPSNPVPIASGMDGRGSCTSIADSSGNLVSYAFTRAGTNSHSTHIFNSHHVQIQSADSITGAAWYNELVMFPKPGRTLEYELFSAGLEPNINNGLYYTLIDMKLNGGAGAVVTGNKRISSEVHADCLTGVKHGNGRDWWIIGKLKTPPP